jgi:hypothetical protein
MLAQSKIKLASFHTTATEKKRILIQLVKANVSDDRQTARVLVWLTHQKNILKTSHSAT